MATPFPNTTRQLRLVQRPKGMFSNDNFKLVTAPLPEPKEGEVLVKTLVLSLDPTHRIWASEKPQYMAPVNLNDVMRCITAVVVLKSRDPKVPEGQYGSTNACGLAEYGVIKGADFYPFFKQPKSLEDVQQHMSVYSLLMGFTAFGSVFEVLKPKHSDIAVVSGAAGAVGSMVVQMCKLAGATVIGIAGSAEKIAFLKEIGVDYPINYKTEDVESRLAEFKGRITLYHDNVGGDISAKVLPNMALHGRVCVCGFISQYNNEDEEKPVSLDNFQFVLHQRLEITGFLVTDYMDILPKFYQYMEPLIESGKIKYAIDYRIGGLQDYVATENLLFTGGNNGKLLLQIADHVFPTAA